MTDDQAKRIIELLESIDKRLESVISGSCTIDVTVKDVHTSVEVHGDVTAHDPR